jgi:hypothetical protein
VTDEREVPLVIHEILSDKKVARAAHPAIFAYRIAKEVGGAAGKVYAAGEYMDIHFFWLRAVLPIPSRDVFLGSPPWRASPSAYARFGLCPVSTLVRALNRLL